jgi:hypothetical protein
MNKQDLKKKIGQLFIVGYQGTEPDKEFLDFVEEWGIGGVIVFALNLSDPENLPIQLERIAKLSDKNFHGNRPGRRPGIEDSQQGQPFSISDGPGGNRLSRSD